MTKLMFPCRVQDLSDYMRGLIPPHAYTPVANMYFRIDPTNRNPSLYDAVRSLIASTCGYTRVVLQLRAQAEKEASMARTKPLCAPAPISPSSTSASASRSTTKDNVRGADSRPSSCSPSPTPFAFSHSHHHVGQPPKNGQLQGYPLGMTQQAPSQTSLAFRSSLLRLRRAPVLRALVPTVEGDWLSDKSVQECEEECKRARVLHLMWVGETYLHVPIFSFLCASSPRAHNTMPQRNGLWTPNRAAAHNSFLSLDKPIPASVSFLTHGHSASSCTTLYEVT